MGIKGLLPVLKESGYLRTSHVRQHAGKTIAIDVSGWLYRAAYSCASILLEGGDTNRYVTYILRRCALLREYGVMPYLVFDGAKLPNKSGTNDSRRETRAANLAEARRLAAAGEQEEAAKFYGRAVTVTPVMRAKVIEACRGKGFHFVVAPYEADAQMAFLAREGIVDGVLSEDSDCVAFRCPLILFKLEPSGACMELRYADMGRPQTPVAAGPDTPAAGGAGAAARTKTLSFHLFTPLKLTQTCILAGCDYLGALDGLGFKTAHKYMRRFATMDQVFWAMAADGMRVDDEYRRGFERALLTFCHQRIYCPQRRKLLPLQPFAPGVTGGPEMDFLGPDMADADAVAVAEGRIDPDTMKPYERPAEIAGGDELARLAARNNPATSTFKRFKPVERPPQPASVQTTSVRLPEPPQPTAASSQPLQRRVSPAATPQSGWALERAASAPALSLDKSRPRDSPLLAGPRLERFFKPSQTTPAKGRRESPTLFGAPPASPGLFATPPASAQKRNISPSLSSQASSLSSHSLSPLVVSMEDDLSAFQPVKRAKRTSAPSKQKSRFFHEDDDDDAGDDDVDDFDCEKVKRTALATGSKKLKTPATAHSASRTPATPAKRSAADALLAHAYVPRAKPARPVGLTRTAVSGVASLPQAPQRAPKSAAKTAAKLARAAVPPSPVVHLGTDMATNVGPLGRRPRRL